MSLLESCGPALQRSSQLLLEVIFTLAQDEWRQVALPCQQWLAANRKVGGPGGGRAPLQGQAVVKVVLDLLEGLPKAVRSGDDAAALHSRRLTTAMQVPKPYREHCSTLIHICFHFIRAIRCKRGRVTRLAKQCYDPT